MTLTSRQLDLPRLSWCIFAVVEHQKRLTSVVESSGRWVLAFNAKTRCKCQQGRMIYMCARGRNLTVQKWKFGDQKNEKKEKFALYVSLISHRTVLWISVISSSEVSFLHIAMLLWKIVFGLESERWQMRKRWCAACGVSQCLSVITVSFLLISSH